MKSPPHAENGTAVRRQPHGSKPKTEKDNVQVSANIHASERSFSFRVGPGHRYGFDLFADVDGRVRIQQRSFDGFGTVLLHIAEAELQAARLPAAIRAATALKEAA